MINNLCTKCGGKGFYWLTLNSGRKRQGPACTVCKGTGVDEGSVNSCLLIALAIVFIAGLIFYFIVK